MFPTIFFQGGLFIMKRSVWVKGALVSMALGAVVMSGCSERQETAEAPKAQEVERRVESAAESNDYDAKAAQQTFETHCASCHPDGGNIMNSQKTLKKESLAESGMTTAQDIVDVMRDPGQGMPAFDAETIPDDRALELGRYILETFK